jgi:hypothetical protein
MLGNRFRGGRIDLKVRATIGTYRARTSCQSEGMILRSPEASGCRKRVSGVSIAAAILLSVAGCGGGAPSQDELARSVLQAARIEAAHTTDQFETAAGEAVDFHGPAACKKAQKAAHVPSGKKALYECFYRLTSGASGPVDASIAVTIYSLEESCWEGVATGYTEKQTNGEYNGEAFDQKQLDSGRFDRKGCVGK